MLSRRKFLTAGAASALCTPSIVRAQILMPIRGIVLCNDVPYHGFVERLMVHTSMQSIQPYLFQGRSISEIAMQLNARDRRYINGSRWDTDAVLNVIKAADAIRDCDRRRRWAEYLNRNSQTTSDASRPRRIRN